MEKKKGMEKKPESSETWTKYNRHPLNRLNSHVNSYIGTPYIEKRDGWGMQNP